MTPALHELLDRPDRVAEIPHAQIPRVLGELEGLRIALLAQLITHSVAATLAAEPDETSQPTDRLLKPAEAAALLQVTTRWLYRHHRSLPFTKKLSRRLLRFDERGLHRWLAHRHG